MLFIKNIKFLKHIPNSVSEIIRTFTKNLDHMISIDTYMPHMLLKWRTNVPMKLPVREEG